MKQNSVIANTYQDSGMPTSTPVGLFAQFDAVRVPGFGSFSSLPSLLLPSGGRLRPARS
ncbi:MAG: hypothetical protein QE278_07170 [Limnobacter sp.]|nr:hypothetical protein [Limnobacter sp.]